MSINEVILIEKLNRNRIFTGSLLTLLIMAMFYLFTKLAPFLLAIVSFFVTILTPFLIAMVISYVLNPLVNVLNRRKVPRPIAVILIYLCFIVFVTVITMNALPSLVTQLKDVSEHIPQLMAQIQVWIEEYRNNQYSLPESVRIGIESSLVNIEKTVTSGITKLLGGFGSMVNYVLLMFLVPFLAFYMLRDMELIERFIMKLIPTKNRKDWIRLFKNIDEALGNYIRGQLFVCLIVGLLAYVGYIFIDLPFPMVLAIIVGIANVIPYIGPFIGAAPALLIALTESTNLALSVVIVNVIIQLIESNVLSPIIVGKSLHIHPLMIIFALLIGGEVAGVPGLVLAVPFFAVMKVIIQHIANHYIYRKPKT